MQTLKFNTKEKTVQLFDSEASSFTFDSFTFDNVSTVSIRDGYYEVMQKKSDKTTAPVARLPISNTNMLIEN